MLMFVSHRTHPIVIAHRHAGHQLPIPSPYCTLPFSSPLLLSPTKTTWQFRTPASQPARQRGRGSDALPPRSPVHSSPVNKADSDAQVRCPPIQSSPAWDLIRPRLRKTENGKRKNGENGINASQAPKASNQAGQASERRVLWWRACLARPRRRRKTKRKTKTEKARCR